ncbi:MM3350-like domain-containing protein [Mucidula mucida]|nr:MM3350-like domain-containing protein [Mucidula mucida]
MPFSSSNPMFGIAKMMGFTDSDLTRTATHAGQRPTFVTFAPNDDGAYLHDVFFEHPDTYKKHVGPDGRIRSWGFYPRNPLNDGHMVIRAREMEHQMTYAPFGKFSLPRPEDQFMKALLENRKRALKQVNLGDLTRRDYVLKIYMPYGLRPFSGKSCHSHCPFREILKANGEPRIWRRFVVSGGMALDVYQDKILAPLMGWVRNFHGHLLTDYLDGTQFGPKKSKAIDMMHLDLSGYGYLNEDEFCVAHMLAKTGDVMKYQYDLGDHNDHDIELEYILPLESSTGAVKVLAGSGICPMENSEGNAQWAKKLETLKNGSPKEKQEAMKAINSSPNYRERGWNLRRNFDPDYFDLAETQKAVMTALGTKGSFTEGAKMFVMPTSLEGFFVDSREHARGKISRKVTTEITATMNKDSWGYFEELKKDGRDKFTNTACGMWESA